MNKQQVIEILNLIDINVWILLFKGGAATFIIILLKNLTTHLYNYLALRNSSGFGVNTKIRYNGKLYYLDRINFTNVVLTREKERVFIPIQRFMSWPIEVIRNGTPKDDLFK